jgi:ketosteroid isomerase-like protein
MYRLISALAICVLLPVTALAGPARSHIDETLVQFVNAFNGGDGAAVAALYTEDAELLPPNSAPVRGRQAIQDFWQGAIDAGMTLESLGAIEVEAQGHMAAEVGAFVLNVPGENGQITSVGGKYIVVWRRDGHTWRLHKDIWNTN